MRDRLIELLNASFEEQYAKRMLLTAPHTADALLAAGVIVPPCKVGDTLYGIRTSAKTGETYIEEFEVAEVMYVSTRGVRPFIISCFGGKKYYNADFGKIVFRDRGEAEKALAERREGNV